MKIQILSAAAAAISLVFVSACLPPVPPTIKQLSVGENHACSLDNKISGVICWGDNSVGQSSAPYLSNPHWISAGGRFSCAIDDTGVSCWGANDQGQTDVPAGLISPRSVSAGAEHACALDGSSVRCWGSDLDGQVSSMPAIVGAKSVQSGAYHSCAIDSEGVKCWGRGTQGQLDVPALTSPSSLALGAEHSCVLDAGQIKCWGGTAAIINNIPSVSQPSLLAAGAFHNCVIDGAEVKCWGGQNGDAVLTPRDLTLPTGLAVGGLSNAVGGVEAFACSRHLQGIACWGENSAGQADYNGAPYHSLYRGESIIDVAAADVWAVLIDLDSYPQWNPFTIRMRSTLQLGAPMRMDVKMAEDIVLDQTESIRVIDHVNYKVCWGINTATPEFNSGERCQWLESISATQTRYITEDLIEGSSTPGVTGSIGSNLQSGFDGVAEQLKIRAEALYTP